MDDTDVGSSSEDGGGVGNWCKKVVRRWELRI